MSQTDWNKEKAGDVILTCLQAGSSEDGEVLV